MKKKIIATTLILALSLSLAAAAMAVSVPGQGTIVFDRGGVLIIDPPESPLNANDLNNPNDPYNWNLGGKDISFGQQIITRANLTYRSDETADLLVWSGNGNVRGFHVVVGIDDFYVGGTVTMRDFELTLTATTPAGRSTFSPATVNVRSMAEGIGAGETQNVFSVNIPAGSSNYEYYAGSWNADLFVIGASATLAGEAKAAMTWNVVVDD